MSLRASIKSITYLRAIERVDHTQLAAHRTLHDKVIGAAAVCLEAEESRNAAGRGRAARVPKSWRNARS